MDNAPLAAKELDWALKMLTSIKAGKDASKTWICYWKLATTSASFQHDICGLADGAAWPLKNAIRKFRGEFEEYIQRTNPQGYLETNPVPALELIGVH